MFAQLLLNGIIIGAIYSLMALGYALVYNPTKTFHIAYSVIYMITPYFFMTLYKSYNLSFSLSVSIALLLTMVVSILIDILVYQPLVKNKSSNNIITISSIGVMTIVINLIAIFYGNETKILNYSISKSVSFSNLILVYSQIYQFAFSISIIIIFFLLLKYTKFGIITRAMSNNNQLASIFGLDTIRFRYLLFALSGLFAAIAGLLIALDVGMDPYVGMPMFLNAVVALIIGGVGSFRGTIVGGFFLGIIQSMTIWAFSSRWQSAITFVLLIIFIIVRPQGLFGEKERIV